MIARAWAALRSVQPAFWLIAALVVAYYHWSAGPPSKIHRYYNLQTEAFLRGHTYLPLEPDPRLLALPDPYDPQTNAELRAHDLSLYRGKYYLYFGPVPVLVLYLPARALLGIQLSDQTAAWLFAVGGFLAGCALLRLLLARCGPASPSWFWPAMCAGLAFCNCDPFVLCRPAFYEVAILSGQCFLLAGLWLLAGAALTADRPSRARLLAGGACLGLAFAARPPLIFGALALGWLWLLRPDAPRMERLRAIALAALPLVAAGLAVAVYNYVRFDSPFEFGNSYQLAGFDIRHFHYFSPGRLPINLYLSVLAPPTPTGVFPFLLAQPVMPFVVPRGFPPIEPIVGLVFLSPLIVALAGLPWAVQPGPAKCRMNLAASAVLLAMAAAILGLISSLGTTMRYQADVATLLFVAAAVLWGAWLAPPRGRAWIRGAWVVLLSLGCVTQAIIGITGYNDSLRNRSPAQYRALARLFAPLEKILGGTAGIEADLEVRPADSAVGAVLAQPLVTMGRTGAGDFVALAVLPGDKLHFRIDHWGIAPVWSAKIDYDPTRPVAVRVVVTDRIRIFFGGENVLTTDFPPYSIKGFVFGRNELGGGVTAEAFAGKIRVVQLRKLLTSEAIGAP